jgi:thiamine-phosphate pyrophosphorylase
MFEIVAVTNRRLCSGDFLERLDAVAAAGVSAVILREKDLSPADYEALFSRALAVCARRGTPLVAHGFAEVARRAGCGLHLPFSALEAEEALAIGAEGRAEDRAAGGILPRGVRTGVSVHSLPEARRAVLCGAAYVTAGHIFPTDSKPGREPRGLRFLSELCGALPVPVRAIGGVSERNIAEVKRAGAAGACLMSSFMTCADPAAHWSALWRVL